MINMVNKYKDELDIYGAVETSDPETYFIDAPHEFFEVFHIDILEQLYDVLDEYVQEDDDPIVYKDYMIVKDYLELYYAMNN